MKRPWLLSGPEQVAQWRPDSSGRDELKSLCVSCNKVNNVHVRSNAQRELRSSQRRLLAVQRHMLHLVQHSVQHLHFVWAKLLIAVENSDSILAQLAHTIDCIAQT